MNIVKFTEQASVLRENHTSKGNQPKWLSNGKWYKADQLGYEALAEVLVAWIFRHSNIVTFVDYSLCKIATEKESFNGSCCDNFRGKEKEIVPLERLHRAYKGIGLAEKINGFHNPKEAFLYTISFVETTTGLTQFGQYLAIMLEMDAFFLNEDRHTNNIAVLRDNETKQYSLCPYFDHGLSFLSDTIDYPLDADVYQCVGKVKAKPFSRSFDEQFDLSCLIKHNKVEITFSEKERAEFFSSLEEYYDSDAVKRVEKVFRIQCNKFNYLLSQNP